MRKGLEAEGPQGRKPGDLRGMETGRAFPREEQTQGRPCSQGLKHPRGRPRATEWGRKALPLRRAPGGIRGPQPRTSALLREIGLEEQNGVAGAEELTEYKRAFS